MAAGEIVGGEFMDRQDIAELRGQRISRVVVLVRALESRDPESVGIAFDDSPTGFGRRRVEMVSQAARRVFQKSHRLRANQRRSGSGLCPPNR